MNKPGVTKGGQIVMVNDVECVHLRAYVHRHKMHNHTANFKARVPKKVHIIIEKLEYMVVGYKIIEGENKVYNTQP